MQASSQVNPRVYLAQVELKVGGRHGKILTIAPGSTIDSFETWPYDNQLSLLRLGHVKLVGGRHTANLTTADGYLHFETPPALPVNDPLVPVVEAETSVLSEDAGAEAHRLAGPEVAVKPAAIKTTVICQDCNKPCNGPRGLLLHRAKAHPGVP